MYEVLTGLNPRCCSSMSLGFWLASLPNDMYVPCIRSQGQPILFRSLPILYQGSSCHTRVSTLRLVIWQCPYRRVLATAFHFRPVLFSKTCPLFSEKQNCCLLSAGKILETGLLQPREVHSCCNYLQSLYHQWHSLEFRKEVLERFELFYSVGMFGIEMERRNAFSRVYF